VIAVDTNVIVRLVTNDDPTQSPRAAQLFVREDIYVPKTVVLETEWVLRGAYELAPDVIRNAFERLMEVPSVAVEDAPAVRRALAWFAAGMDFADAVHLASSIAAAGFATFDKPLAKRARKLEGTPPVTLL
jgi:predicted nucleic-acid-binding protein